MNKLLRAALFVGGIIVVGIGWAFAQSLLAGGTQTIPYHGILENAGAPVNYEVGLRFQLFANAAPTEGETALWTETHDPVEVAAGRFSVNLGSIAVLDTTGSVLRRGDLYLAVTVVRDATGVVNIPLLGRQSLGATPYAWGSAPGQDFRVDANLAVGGSATVGSTLDVAGPVTVGGATSNPVTIQGGQYAGITIDDRTDGQASWITYVANGTFRIWQAFTGDRMSIDGSGNMRLSGAHMPDYDSGWVAVGSADTQWTPAHGLNSAPRLVTVEACGSVTNFSAGCTSCFCNSRVVHLGTSGPSGVTNPVTVSSDGSNLYISFTAGRSVYAYWTGTAWSCAPDNNCADGFYRVYAWR